MPISRFTAQTVRWPWGHTHTHTCKRTHTHDSLFRSPLCFCIAYTLIYLSSVPLRELAAYTCTHVRIYMYVYICMCISYTFLHCYIFFRIYVYSDPLRELADSLKATHTQACTHSHMHIHTHIYGSFFDSHSCLRIHLYICFDIYVYIYIQVHCANWQMAWRTSPPRITTEMQRGHRCVYVAFKGGEDP